MPFTVFSTTQKKKLLKIYEAQHGEPCARFLAAEHQHNDLHSRLPARIHPFQGPVKGAQAEEGSEAEEVIQHAIQAVCVRMRVCVYPDIYPFPHDTI